MSYPLCRHILTSGRRCKAAALNAGVWCYFHQHMHQSHKPYRQTEATRGYLIPGQHLELAPLEDRQSIQLALSVVINALATGNLDSKRATALLYGLQVASMNSAHLDSAPGGEAVRTATANPEGLNLAEPASEENEPFTWDEEEEEEE